MKFLKRTVNRAVQTLLALATAGQSLGQSSPPLSDSALSKGLGNPASYAITLPLFYQPASDQAVSPFRLNEDWVWGAVVQTLGASSPPLSETELSKESENPVTRLITLPLRYETDFNNGPPTATKDTFEIDQAVLPFSLNEDWALIARTRFPAVSQPPKKSAFQLTKMRRHHSRGRFRPDYFYTWPHRAALPTVRSNHRSFSDLLGIQCARFLMRRGLLCLLILIPVLLATGWIGGKLPQGFVPTEDQGYLYANLQLPEAALKRLL